jgi:ubiquinone/menaquinone biosynthesis C-methylase UbiE
MSNYFEDKWAGDFGKKYTLRCPVDHKPRVEMFKKLFKGLKIDSVLEAGCNMGHNLMAIQELAVPGRYVEGIDINQYAIDKSPIKLNLKKASIFDMGYKDESFDMVMTLGVLIHIHADDLTEALLEMNRTAKKYVMLIEYTTKGDEIGREYRDMAGKQGVWARDWKTIYKGLFPKSKLIKTGRVRDLISEKWGTNECDYFIWEK